MTGPAPNDGKSRALLVTALHPSSSPNERLMALAALGRAIARAGLAPSDVMLATAPDRPQHDGGDDARREAALQADEIATLNHRLKAQDAAARKAARAAAALDRTIADLRAALAAQQAAADADACQIAALETDLAARDRIIATLESRLAQRRETIA